MRHFRTFSVLVTLLVASLTLGPAADAQNIDLSLGAFVGFGGSPDSDGYGGSGFQLMAAMELTNDAVTGLRFGELGVDLENGLESDLTYLTLGTEYRRDADYYESGLLIGIGYYQIDGGGIDEDSLGLNLGVTGEFKINDRFSAVVEFSGHYADFDDLQIFIMGHAGIVFHL